MNIRLISPLKWPAGLAQKAIRERASYTSLPIPQNLKRLRRIAMEMDLQNVRLYSNLKLSEEGEILGRSGSTDPGVALYCTIRDEPYVLASDQFRTVRDNFHAIIRALDGYRLIFRYKTKAHKIELS